MFGSSVTHSGVLCGKAPVFVLVPHGGRGRGEKTHSFPVSLLCPQVVFVVVGRVVTVSQCDNHTGACTH